MLKTKKSLTLGLTIVLLFTLVNFATEKVSAASSKQIYWGKKFNIQPNKEWKINFNMAVDSNFVNSNYFYVLDENSIKHPTKAYIDINNPEIIHIVPTENYINNKAYSLYVKSGIKSTNGKIMKNTIKMDFVIEEGRIQSHIEQEKYSNGTGKVKLTISLKDSQDTPLSGYDASNFEVRIKQLSNEIFSFADSYPFSNFTETENGIYKVDFNCWHDSIFDFINLKAKENIISEYLFVETPKNIAELTNFPNSYTIKEMPNIIEGITNPDEGKKLTSGFIQIKYRNWEQGHNYNLDNYGNWVSSDLWFPVIDTSSNKDLSTFALSLSPEQLDAIYRTISPSTSYCIKFKGLYDNEQIISEIKYFTIN